MKRWDRTGIVLENEGDDKYMVKVDGSGRIVHRNRRYLRRFKPMESSQPAHSPHFQEVTRYGPTQNQSQSVVPQFGDGDKVGEGDREIILTQPRGTLTDLPPTHAIQTQPVPELQPTGATSVPPSPPAVTVNSPPIAPPVVEPREAAEPVRRSGRVSKPNPKYSSGEYDLSQD